MAHANPYRHHHCNQAIAAIFLDEAFGDFNEKTYLDIATAEEVISARSPGEISRRSPGDLRHGEQEVESLRRKKYAKENELAQLEAAVEKKARPMRCRCDADVMTT